ncbi:SMC-Scp complex subunit ScpB [Selenomonas bovis]|uniref:SMC-Scp complex subunit ScpB n=1 Tax=Selenomonas bovis TaxID=416586 RepID=UPI00037503C9|nr:SMC-Scp complex subunit ScpB [Selenomonas bovis]
MDERDALGTLEAVLFAAGDPVRLDALQKIFAKPPETLRRLAEKLKERLEARGSGLTLREVAGGYQLVTRPEYYDAIEKLTQVVDRRLTAPTMETLSIIAFKQPITKAEIEAIRGVRAEKALARLLEYELIAEVGRKQAIGRPILYGTTDRFLQVFGLKSLEDLPSLPTDEEALAQLDVQQLSLIDRGRLPGN